MTDNEKSSALTDAEIIKTLNEALHGLHYISIYCADRKGNYIASVRVIDVINLINRLQSDKEALIAGQETLQKALAEKNAEIERLQNALTEERVTKINLGCNFAIASIKEFAERLKKLFDVLECQYFDEDITMNTIRETVDNLVKEMLED